MRFQTPVTPVLLVKSISLTFGLLTLILGLVSHYESGWVKPGYLGFWRPIEDIDGRLHVAPYRLCALLDIYREAFIELSYPRCPRISMEKFFITTIIGSFFLSLIFYAVGFCISGNSKTILKIDIVAHLLIAAFLMVGSVLFIVSANQIQTLSHDFPITDLNLNEANLRTLEKLITGGFGICLSFLYAAAAVILYKT